MSSSATARRPPPLPTAPTAAATVGADGRMPTAEVDGVTVFLAPDPPAEARLPRYPDAGRLAIPRHLGPAPVAIRAQLEPGGAVPQPLRAVFLVVAAGGGYHLVLFAPDAPFQVEVTGVRINQREGVQSALGPRSVSDDRHRLVVPQPGRVVVLDARDGSALDIEVPDPTLSLAGWARDRTTVVARGRDYGWLVNPGTREVRRAAYAANPDWADLAQGDGTAAAAHLLGVGRADRQHGAARATGGADHRVGVEHRGLGGRRCVPPGRLPGRPWTGRRGSWRCSPTCRRAPRVLAATTGPLVPKGAYRALAWGPRDVVLFESRSERAGFQGLVRRVLAWDVNEGRLYQVADVDRASSAVGDFSGTYTL